MTSRQSWIALAMVLHLLVVAPGCQTKPAALAPLPVHLTNNGTGGACAQNGVTDYIDVQSGQNVDFIAPTVDTYLSIDFSGGCPFSACPVTGKGIAHAGPARPVGAVTPKPYSSVIIGNTACPNVGGGGAGTFGLRIHP